MDLRLDAFGGSWPARASRQGRAKAVLGLTGAGIPGNEQPTQNWYGQGESDCLIKTKQSDGRKTMLTLCDFCPVL